MKENARILTRITISVVVLWFGINQLINPEAFLSYLPNNLLALDYATQLIIINGIIDITLGTLLIIGLKTRIIAYITSIHTFIISLSLEYNDIAMRDMGLALITCAIGMGGKDKWCIDNKW